MSAHPITHDYLRTIGSKANRDPRALGPDETWSQLGIADDDTLRRTAGALQNVAGAHSAGARITLGELTAAKDVAGGHMLTWKEAGLGDLTRDQSIAEIRAAQSELASRTAVEASAAAAVAVKAKKAKRARKPRKAKKPKETKKPKKAAIKKRAHQTPRRQSGRKRSTRRVGIRRKK